MMTYMRRFIDVRIMVILSQLTIKPFWFFYSPISPCEVNLADLGVSVCVNFHRPAPPSVLCWNPTQRNFYIKATLDLVPEQAC